MLRALPLLTLIGCDADFSVSRGVLGPFRVAGVGTTLNSDGDRVARAALYSGLGLYHDARPSLVWTLDGVQIGEGYDVVVSGDGVLGLTATNADGAVQAAEVTVADPPSALSVRRSAYVYGDDLSLEARQSATVTEVQTSADSGSALRLNLDFADPADASADRETHWMIAGDPGSVLAEDRFAADIFPGEVLVNDGVYSAPESATDGLYHQLALVIDGAGSNTWIWTDAAIGLTDPVLRHHGRLLPVSESDAAAAGVYRWVSATLASADSLEGLTFSQIAPADDGAGGPDLSQQDDLPCLGDQPFDLDFVVEGRCARPDLDGARVVLELW